MIPNLTQLKQKFSKKPAHNTPSSYATSDATSDATDDSLVRVSTKSLIELRKKAESIPLNAYKIMAPQSGTYLSPFKGRGMEFEESRIYQPGDDVRNMDWRVTARTGTAHTKVFQEERERTVLMWVDYRRPMFFATQGAFKSVLAAKAAALLSWSAAQHGDRLGGLIFSEQHHQELRPQRGDKAVLHFLKSLSGHPAWEQKTGSFHLNGGNSKSAGQSLIRLRRVARPGSLIILFSDFRNLGPQEESHLIQLSRHNDVIMLFIYDPLEEHLPPAGMYQVSDGTNSMVINTGDTGIQRTHQQQFQRHKEYLQTLCIRYGMFLLTCSTDQNLEHTLQRGFGLKQK